MSENTAENLEVEQEENVVPDIEVQVVDDTPQEDQEDPLEQRELNLTSLRMTRLPSIKGMLKKELNN